MSSQEQVSTLHTSNTTTMKTEHHEEEQPQEEEQIFTIAIPNPEEQLGRPIPESVPQPALTTQAPASAPAPKSSRLSIAFQKITSGCGLCFHPLKNNGPNDYHTLVITPTDELPPLLGENYAATSSQSDKGTGASTSHPDPSHDEPLAEETVLARETKDIPPAAKETFVPPTVIEEVTLSDDDDQALEAASSEVVEPTPVANVEGTGAIQEEEPVAAVEPPAEATEQVIERALTKESLAAIANSEVSVPSSPAPPRPQDSPSPAPAVTPTSSPAPARAGAFAKFTKRSPSQTLAGSAQGSPTPTAAATTTSPLLERLGRFAKIIRPSETASSMQSKVDSLQVSSAPAPASALSSSLPASKTFEPLQLDIQETILSEPDPADVPTSVSPKESRTMAKQGHPQVPENEPALLWTRATPPIPPQPQQQQQQQYNRRDSTLISTLAVDTAVKGSTIQPMAIPGPSPKTPLQLVHPWTQSPTLHPADASSSSGQSLLAKGGRASTMDSTLEGSEAGSLDSGSTNAKETTAKRRKSVLKKLGKMINGMNRKDSKDSKEKRISRQGSITMESPREAEEHFGF